MSKKNRKIEPKISQLSKQSQGKFLMTLLRVALIVALSVALPVSLHMLYRYLESNRYFAANHIEITGNLLVSDKEIIEASGLEHDDINLLNLDGESVKRNIEALPWVKGASLSVDLPDNVAVKITEWVAAGLVLDGELVLVDKNADIIKAWDDKDGLYRPIISGTGIVSGEKEVVIQAFELYRQYRETGLDDLMPLDEIHYDSAIGYTLFADRTEIRVGFEAFSERLKRLADVRKILAEKNVAAEYILLDSESRPNEIVLKAHPIATVEDESNGVEEEVAGEGNAPDDDTNLNEV